ncbi:MAG: hypothetical protein WKF84_25800 [Pyrinomonadaceae bacterium]
MRSPQAPPPLRLITPEEPTKIEVEDDDLIAAATASPGTLIEEIKDGLERKKKLLLVTALEGARQVSFEDNELVIKFATGVKHLRDSLAKPESINVLREVCREVMGRDVGVRITIGDSDEVDNSMAPLSAAEEARQEKRKLRELAENHPTVQHLLRTFHGEILDVSRIDPEST